MTLFIFVGDMLVMGFMIGLAIWFSNSSNDDSIAEIARIPLIDEEQEADHHG